MRWSIIRTIWFREMRDQLRDRRTLLVIVGLPLILYPLLGYAVVRVAVEFAEKPSVIGLLRRSGAEHDFPERRPASAGLSPASTLAWLSLTPGGGIPQAPAASALARAGQLHLDYPPLIANGRLTTFDSKYPPREAQESAAQALLQFVAVHDLESAWRDERKIELILEAPGDFFTQLDFADGSRSLIHVHMRPGDERGRLALRRLTPLLDVWKSDLKRVRLARKGLAESYVDPFEVKLPDEAAGKASRESAINLVMRFFPLMLVMWTLSGALYPAIDLCAGEKERGTMETLLITPAGREEIVLGKFLTIWVFSSGTALVNLLSMGLTTAMFGGDLPHGGISVAALLWCVILSLPQSALFSALGLAIGAYARSSKEGQYYLMPLFVVTMPLIGLTLAPGVELNPLYSLVPVTGVALLMQRLMSAADVTQIPWAYFVPVLAPIGLYSWLALRWAIEQFNREEVLFREAERLDIVLWFKRLFRDKEALPTTGQAFFCLGVLIGLRWLTQGMGSRWTLEMVTAIGQLTFVAMPPLFMVILLNTQPAQGLYLRWPLARETGLAALLAMLLLAPMIGLTRAVADWFPLLLEGTHPLMAILREIQQGQGLKSGQVLTYLLAFALLPALCEEVAFRGFVLRGLHHGFRPRNAVLLSSFFFALFHLNVFLFAPTFLLGVVLGLMTVRSRSLLPAVCFHLLHNSVLIALIPLSSVSNGWMPSWILPAVPWLIGTCAAAAAALIWWLYRKPYVDKAREEAADSESNG